MAPVRWVCAWERKNVGAVREPPEGNAGMAPRMAPRRKCRDSARDESVGAVREPPMAKSALIEA